MLKSLSLAFAALLLTSTASAQPKRNYEIKPADMTMGNRNAKVVLIEYGAFTCSHCAAFAQEVMPQIKKSYVDTGKVLFIFRLFPRGPEDGMAEKMARCVPGRYFQVADVIFRNHAKWAEYNIANPAAELKKLGPQAGLTAAQVDRCTADRRDDARITQVGQEALDRYGLDGTPLLIINGEPQPSGTISAPNLAKLLDAALAKAK